MSGSNVIRLGNGILLDSKGKLLCQTVDKSCSNCKWPTDSRGSVTDVCKEWEKRDETSAGL